MKNIPVQSFSIKEVTVDIQASDLAEEAVGFDVLILRVVGMTSGSGRPVTKSVRIPADMLRDIENEMSWHGSARPLKGTS